jgi:predicted nuclease of restriction endonuclease-like (RecB) superfamily
VGKNPYILDFLNLKNTFLEQDLERDILQKLETFIFIAGYRIRFYGTPRTNDYRWR